MIVSRIAALLLLVAMVVVRLWDPAPVEALRLRSFDAFQAWAKPRPQYLPTQIVAIDEDSLRAYGQWPWSRSLLGVLIGRIHEQGASTIGLAFPLAEPDRTSPPLLAAKLYNLSKPGVAALRALPDFDVMLAKAIAGNGVVIGRTASSAAPVEGLPVPPAPPAKIGLWGTGDIRKSLRESPSVIPALPVLEKAAEGVGLLNIYPDRDGMVRRLPAAMLAQGEITPSLAVEVVRVASGSPNIVLHARPDGIDSVRIAKFNVPTDPRGFLWNRARPHDPTRFISAKRFLDNDLPPDTLAGRLVLVGTDTPELAGRGTTPAGLLPEVEIHAQAVDSILAGTALARPDDAKGLETALAILAGLLLIVALPQVAARWTLPLLLAVEVNLLGLSVVAFFARGLLVDATHPAMTALLVYLVLSYASHCRLENSLPPFHEKL